MKVQFEFDEKDIENNKERFEKIDEKAESLGLKKLSFGNYEGVIDEGCFSCATMWVLTYPFIADEGLFYNVWYDKENLEKKDVMAAYKEVDEVFNTKPLRKLTQEYNNLLKEAGLPNND